MTLSISLSPEVEARLKERAAAEGKDPTAYVSDLVTQVITQPSLEELLAVSQAEFASTGMTSDEVMDFGRELLEKIRDEKAPKA
ncbi:MAG TPA: hypothetical protein VIM11_21125 [Tepidisphaeraceae bacterium]|jgi:predicted DNA-binding protein